MKWKNEIPNKTEFMKINSFNFIECEKFHSELVHEENVKKFKLGNDASGQRKEVKEKRSPNNLESNNINKERRTMTETVVITKSSSDFHGSAPKRFITKCYIKPTVQPAWYSESLLLNIGSSKKIYDEKIYFKEKLAPFRWVESMHTEVKTCPKYVHSEIIIPTEEFKTEFHYISLEPQQKTAQSTDL